MDIRDFMDIKKLQEIQNQFSDATGLSAVAIGSDGQPVTEPSNVPEFYAKFVLDTDEAKKCLEKHDSQALNTFLTSVGLKGFTFEIEVDGEVLGFVRGGSVRTAEVDEEKARKRAEELGKNPDAYIRALKNVPMVEEKKAIASIKFFETVINQLVEMAYNDRRDSGRIEDLSKEITYATEVIETINNNTHSLKSIANKQKMLSLNASIEAARSGEAGVGFAVVAKSMGDLSSQSATIYGDIEKSVAEVTEAIQKLDHLFHD